MHASRNEDLYRAMTPYETWDAINHGDPEGRIAIGSELKAAPGKQLVFVRYSPQHQFQEWVYNAANIDQAPIVWARDLGPQENQKLLQLLSGPHSVAAGTERQAAATAALSAIRRVTRGYQPVCAMRSRIIDAVIVHPLGLALQRRGNDGGEPRRLLAIQLRRRHVIVKLRRSFGAIDSAAPFDHVQIQLQNPVLGQKSLGQRHQGKLHAFAKKRPLGRQKQILDQLLRDGGPAAPQPMMLHIVFDNLLHFDPVESVMLAEPSVFGCYHGVL